MSLIEDILSRLDYDAARRRAELMRKRYLYALVPLFLVIPAMISLYSSCSSAESRLSVFAAAGAKPAVDKVCLEFERQYGNVIEVSYGGGGEMLANMIMSESGDIYIAPEQGFMEAAREKKAILPETIKSVAYMIPVIAVQKGNPEHIVTLADLARPGIRVAITRPETTLLGKYAPEIFSKAGLAEAIEKNIVTQAVRPDSLLTMLIMKQVDAGITWHFYQVQAPDEIEIIYLSPQQLTGIGEMQAAVSSYTGNKKAAQQFVDFMISTDSKAIFRSLGYIVDPEEVKGYWLQDR